jgi:Winged helix-turn-helix domain (DUF2582)
MHEEIGTAAGSIWHALDGKNTLTLAQLKREVKGTSPLFDWAIGWLAREDKIAITPRSARSASSSGAHIQKWQANGWPDVPFRSGGYVSAR